MPYRDENPFDDMSDSHFQYGGFRVNWAITANLAGALEAVHYQVGDAIRRAGGHNSDYLGVELKFGW